MKSFFLPLLLCFHFTANSQSGEFTTFENGLIYSPGTMSQLAHIVDSLNLKFKRCDLTRKYFSVMQGKGNHISLDAGNIKEAFTDIKKNISFADFISKYPRSTVDTNMLILKSKDYDESKKKPITEYSGETLVDYGNTRLWITAGDPNSYDDFGKSKWVVEYSPRTEYSNESLEAFYIVDGFQSIELPEKYERMILYSDCVIDTTTGIYTKNAKRDTYKAHNKDVKYKEFYSWLEKKTPTFTAKDVPAQSKARSWEVIDSMTKAWIKENLSQTTEFKQLLANATEEVNKKKSATSDEFEAFVANYYSKAVALEMKRNRIVVGNCSMDQSPRMHAVNIAMLAAESINWGVFLRAHLNIMNDRFDRMSDGSYAWGRRGTYIKELEELNIDVRDLMFGISLRIENPVGKHYYGSISRLGRALAETKNNSELEEQLVSMIKDGKLDTYNRMLMHYLFLNYIYYIPGKDKRLEKLTILKQADKTLPSCILSRIKIKEDDFLKDN